MNDKGHWALMNDLQDLVGRANRGMYHDFHENGLATPKASLVSTLEALISNVKSGMYDN